LFAPDIAATSQFGSSTGLGMGGVGRGAKVGWRSGEAKSSPELGSGIGSTAAASGTNTDSRDSETPPEPYEDRTTAEQPSMTTTVRKPHSSLVEQNLPTRRSASPYTHRTRDGVREWVGRRRSSSGNSLIDGSSGAPPAVTGSRAGASSVTPLAGAIVGMMQTFFSDMMLIEFTRTYDGGAVDGGCVIFTGEGGGGEATSAASLCFESIFEGGKEGGLKRAHLLAAHTT